MQMIDNGLNCLYLWELDFSNVSNKNDNIKLQLTMEYEPVDEEYVYTSKPRIYKCHFDVQNYKVFIIS